MSEQPYMMFEIREKVKHSKDGKSFNALSSLELEPIVKVYEKEKQIEVTGYLVLNGEFQKKQENWEEEFEQADGLHHGEFFNNQQFETFQYQIPISFDIQPERVKDIANVFVSVEQFDYNILSDEEMELITNVKLVGVHPNVLQDRPVDLKYNGDAAEKNTEIASSPTFEEAKKEAEKLLVEEYKEEDLEENKLDEVNKVEVDQESNELESVESEVETIVETEKAKETEASQASSKMKIGIKGQNKERPVKEESPPTPLYSLLTREKKEPQSEAIQENTTEKQVSQEVMNVSQKSMQTEATEESNRTIISMDEYVKGRESVEVADEEQEEASIEVTEEQSRAKANTTTSSTQEMLFSLLKDKEEGNIYKLRMYLVQKNESIETIADRYEIKVSELLQHNKLENQSIEEGQILYLPRKG